jgi:hypothetical protein
MLPNHLSSPPQLTELLHSLPFPSFLLMPT